MCAVFRDQNNPLYYSTMKSMKNENFKSSFIELYINKYSCWEDMINMKHAQNHSYFQQNLFWCRNFSIKPTNLIFPAFSSGAVIYENNWSFGYRKISSEQTFHGIYIMNKREYVLYHCTYRERESIHLTNILYILKPVYSNPCGKSVENVTTLLGHLSLQ